MREVFPGEIVELTREGIKTIDIVDRPDKKPQAFCIFEYVYFARSDSIFEGKKYIILYHKYIKYKVYYIIYIYINNINK